MKIERSDSLPIIAIFISILALAHGISVVEYGVMLGHEKHEVSVLKKFNINNVHSGLNITTNITLQNDGTLPLRMEKIRCLLKLGDSHHVFESLATLNLPPKNIWNGEIKLDEKITDENISNRSQFDMGVANELLIKYQNEKYEDGKIYISEKLQLQAKEFLNENTNWIHTDKNYFLMILIWINGSENDEPSDKKLYQFELDPHQIKVLKEYPLQSYKTPRPDIISDNKFVTFSATPKLAEITDKNMIVKIFSKYKELSLQD